MTHTRNLAYLNATGLKLVEDKTNSIYLQSVNSFSRSLQNSNPSPVDKACKVFFLSYSKIKILF